MSGEIGVLEHRPIDLGTDLELLHGWVTHPRSVFWMMQGASLDDVRQEYAAIAAAAHHDAFLGLRDGVATFLFERYDPAHEPVGAHLETTAGDVGMHVLVAPPTDASRPVHGLTRAVMRHVMSACFADPAVRRVVVDPDVDNVAVRALNREVGFVEHQPIDVPGKTALLSTCTRDAFEEATR